MILIKNNSLSEIIAWQLYILYIHTVNLTNLSPQDYSIIQLDFLYENRHNHHYTTGHLSVHPCAVPKPTDSMRRSRRPSMYVESCQSDDRSKRFHA